MSQLIFAFFKVLIAYNFHQSGLITYLSYKFIYLFFSAVRHPPSAVHHPKWYAVQLFIVYADREC